MSWLLTLSAAVAVSSAGAASLPVPFASFRLGNTAGGRHVEIARERDAGGKPRWIAILTTYQMIYYEERSTYHAWAESRDCPALDRLVAKIRDMERRRLKESDVVYPSEGGEYRLTVYATPKSRPWTFKDKDGNRQIKKRLEPNIDEVELCYHDGLPPEDRRWDPPSAVQVRDSTPDER